MKPAVALVGRPNVGKSTLFNRLTRSRSALVSDQPGVTRDRQYGDGRIGDRPYYVIDTGGLVESFLKPATAGAKLHGQIAAQTAQAIGEADSIIFVLDAREGIAAADREIADALRRAGKPVWLAVNKAEGLNVDVAAAEFHALGLGSPLAVSAAHGEGVSDLMTRVLADLLGAAWGLAASTAVYTLVHIWTFNGPLLLAALVAGLVFGLLYLRTRSLAAPIIAHAVWGVVVFVVLPLG